MVKPQKTFLSWLHSEPRPGAATQPLTWLQSVSSQPSRCPPACPSCWKRWHWGGSAGPSEGAPSPRRASASDSSRDVSRTRGPRLLTAVSSAHAYLLVNLLEQELTELQHFHHLLLHQLVISLLEPQKTLERTKITYLWLWTCDYSAALWTFGLFPADGTEITSILLVNNQTFVFLTEPVC